jgi:integrase/recombinase XerC
VPDLAAEKGETTRWQPVSQTLMARLGEHAAERHAEPDRPLLRYSTGAPLTSRRYDHLWVGIRAELPWAAAHGVSTHWLRHTTLTWVERNFGYATVRDLRPRRAARRRRSLAGEPHSLAPGD